MPTCSSAHNRCLRRAVPDCLCKETCRSKHYAAFIKARPLVVQQDGTWVPYLRPPVPWAASQLTSVLADALRSAFGLRHKPDALPLMPWAKALLGQRMDGFASGLRGGTYWVPCALGLQKPGRKAVGYCLAGLTP